MKNPQTAVVGALVALREPGGFRLPREVLDAWARYQSVGALPVGQESAEHVEDVARRVLAELAEGRAPDVTALAAAQRAAVERAAVMETAHAIQRAAIDQAADAVVDVVRRLADDVISEHLAPVHARLLTSARKAAEDLGDHDPEDRRFFAAPTKPRAAWAKLVEVGRQRTALVEARGRVLTVAGGPQLDTLGQFAIFRTPEVLPGWLGGRGRMRIELPSDPAVRLLSLVREHAAGEPWLPTAAQQDAEWDRVLGDQARTRAAAATAARSLVPQGPPPA